MKKIHLILILIFTSVNLTLSQINNSIKVNNMNEKKFNKTEKEWKEILNEEEYRVLREKEQNIHILEKYNLHFENGVYNCNGCKNPII